MMSFINRSIENLHEAALLLACFAFLSQLLGFLRDRLLAHNFGAGVELDIYYAAFRVPDYIFVTIASLVSVTVLLPFLVEHLSEDKNRARQMLDSIMTVFVWTMVIVSAILFWFMPKLSSVIAPGFSSDEIDQLVLLSRILLLSPFLLGISNLFGSVTQSFQKFFIYALSPIFYNVGIILGILFLYPTFGLSGLAWGVVLGAFLHFGIQITTVLRTGLWPRIVLKPNFNDVKKVVLTSVPRTITLSAHSLVIIVLTAIASFMAEGSITIFNFSFNLQSVPLAMVGVSYSVAAFPALAKLFSRGEREEFLNQVSQAVRLIIFWSLPIASLFIVLRAQIVRTILGSGLFDWSSTRLVAAALALFAISVFAQSLVLLFVRAYYAGGNTRKPLIINIFSSLIIILSAFWFANIFASNDAFRMFFESLFRVSGVPGTDVLMLPLAFTFGMLVNIFIFWFAFQKDFGAFHAQVRRTTRHSFYAAVLLGFVSKQFLELFDDIFEVDTLMGIFSQGFFAGVFGIIAAVLLLKALKNKDLARVWGALRHKFWKRRPVQPSPDELG